MSRRRRTAAALVAALLVAPWLSCREDARESAGAAEAPAGLERVEPATKREADLAAAAAPSREQRARDEPEAEPRAAAVPGEPVAVTILDGAGAVVPRAIVVLHRDEAVLTKLFSDGAGRVLVPREHARCEVAVWAVGAVPPQLTALDVAPREAQSTLHVDAGAVVAGRVLVDDAAPIREFRVTWLPQEFRTLRDCPAAVHRALFNDYETNIAPYVRVERDGSFRIAGVPAASPGTLHWTPELAQEDGAAGENGLSFDAPRADLELRLRSDDVLAGRIVDTSGEIVSDGQVSLKFDEDRYVPAGRGTEGRFRADLRGPLPSRITLRLERSTNGDSHFDHATLYPPANRPREWDVGDVVVSRLPVLVLRVLGASGAPLEGATVSPTVRRNDESVLWYPERLKADEKGRAELRITNDLERVRVDGEGYLPTDLEPPFRDGETVVRLRRAASARVELTASPTASTRQLFVSLLPASAGEPVAGDGEELDWREAFGARAAGLGSIAFDELPPNVALLARVHDATGRVLSQQAVAPIEGGASREIAISLNWNPVTVFLRVRGSDGARIWRARIAVDGRAAARTDVTGETALKGVTPGTVELVLRHEDYDDLRVPEFVLNNSRGWVELTMLLREE